MRRICAIFLFLCISLVSFAQEDTSHPRLFLRSGEEKALLENIGRDSVWTRMHRAVLAECDTMCDIAPMERTLDGPRLHAVSCEVLRRVLFLSYAWRMTGEEKFAARAEREMLHVCGFTDWNPSHFLDVAEMSTALAIGYDWLYERLPQSSRDTIVSNIIRKGLDPAEDPFLSAVFVTRPSRTCNWGQVCNGGMAIAAIALATENPVQSGRIIERSGKLMMLPMEKEYPPQGCYPEGFGYWAFGTQYNILFLAAMEKWFGEESIERYLAVPGFIESGNFSQQLITPSLRTFGYSDNSTRIYLEPAVIWFNTRRADPRMYYMQKKLFEKYEQTHSYVKTIKNRLIPMMLIWGAGCGEAPAVSLDGAKAPAECFYLGKGDNDVCVMRSSWDDGAAYLGFKSGRANNPHGHMDIGSFYFEKGGVRWSLDLGSDHYGDIAAAHVNMFNMAQDSPRWTVLTKYNNFAHSTTFPDAVLQKVDAQCEIGSYRDGVLVKWAQSDLTPLYPEVLDSLVRRASLRGRKVVVRDFVKAGQEPCRMVWTMTTEAVSAVRNGKEILLTAAGGQTLRLKVGSDFNWEMDFAPVEQNNCYENPSDGISWLRIVYTVSSGKEGRFKVKMK